MPAVFDLEFQLYKCSSRTTLHREALNLKFDHDRNPQPWRLSDSYALGKSVSSEALQKVSITRVRQGFGKKQHDKMVQKLVHPQSLTTSAQS